MTFDERVPLETQAQFMAPLDDLGQNTMSSQPFVLESSRKKGQARPLPGSSRGYPADAQAVPSHLSPLRPESRTLPLETAVAVTPSQPGAPFYRSTSLSRDSMPRGLTSESTGRHSSDRLVNSVAYKLGLQISHRISYPRPGQDFLSDNGRTTLESSSRSDPPFGTVSMSDVELGWYGAQKDDQYCLEDKMDQTK
jgi:hypothetical protein